MGAFPIDPMNEYSIENWKRLKPFSYLVRHRYTVSIEQMYQFFKKQNKNTQKFHSYTNCAITFWISTKQIEEHIYVRCAPDMHKVTKIQLN